MMQMILTLKMVGLAFEVNSSYLEKYSKRDKSSGDKQDDVDEVYDINVTFMDIFHYSFNYVGIIAG